MADIECTQTPWEWNTNVLFDCYFCPEAKMLQRELVQHVKLTHPKVWKNETKI